MRSTGTSSADPIAWRAHVAAMVDTARAHQDELFYRLALPGWERELASLGRGDDLTPEPTDKPAFNELTGDTR